MGVSAKDLDLSFLRALKDIVTKREDNQRRTAGVTGAEDIRGYFRESAHELRKSARSLRAKLDKSQGRAAGARRSIIAAVERGAALSIPNAAGP